MMEHKAYIFDFGRFEVELRQTLERALSTEDSAALSDFIKNDPSNFRNPCEGEPLHPDWEARIETKDAHQYGDLALTKYYDPKLDIGLGSEWQEFETLVLGFPIGPTGNVFDPGKMGSYFQTLSLVKSNLLALTKLETRSSQSTNRASQMLEKAIKSGSGLYVTF